MVDEAVLAKIRGVLAKAERGTTTEECEAYAEMAAKLIAKYGVDEALLAEKSNEKPVVGDKIVTLLAPYAMDKAGLLAAIAEPLGCKIVLLKGGSLLKAHLFGFESDLQRVDLLYTSLLIQGAAALRRAERTDKPFNENTKAYRCSWQSGFARAVRVRLLAAEKEAVANAEPAQTGRSVALVMIDRSNEVAHKLKDVYPRLRTQARTLQGSGSGSGYAAGQKANLGSTRGVTGSRGQLGS